MALLESEIITRFPQWFEGRKAPFSKALVRAYSKFCRFAEIERFIVKHGHLKGSALLAQALDFLNVRYAVDHVEQAGIPESGRCIIVANHPAGVIDALALLHFVSRIRPDVRIVANEALGALGLLDDMLIPVSVFNASNRKSGIEAVKRALLDERCIIFFPAGEVSRLRPSGIKDTSWRTGFIRMAAEFGAPVIPVRIHARNSALFYSASTIYKPLGTLLLPREITARRNTRITLRVGKPHTVAAESGLLPSLKTIRQNLYAIGTRSDSRALDPAPLIAAQDPRQIKAELGKLKLLGTTPDGKHIYGGRIPATSVLLQELGRLRELSFRAVGEGTGRRLDIDKFDSWYHHIVLWSPEHLEIAGAYRLAIGEAVYAEHGLVGFYSAGLFEYTCAFLPKIVQGAELGRSFVVPKFWNSRSLDNLWHGIGAFLSDYPQVRYLFGPVSISAELPIAARERLVRHYAYFYGAQEGFATAKRPFRFLGQQPQTENCETDFTMMKSELQVMDVKVPTLYKQYTELCEPGGVQFMAFGVDPEFSNAIDGLLCLDIRKIKPAKYQRYFKIAMQHSRTAA
jgi:putative hemolysin